MPKKKSHQKALGSFTEMVREFGDAVSQVFNDPALKQAARAFTRAAKKSAKTFGDRFKDEEVQWQFKRVGQKAKDFSGDLKSVAKDVKQAAKSACRKYKK